MIQPGSNFHWGGSVKKDQSKKDSKKAEEETQEALLDSSTQ